MLETETCFRLKQANQLMSIAHNPYLLWLMDTVAACTFAVRCDITESVPITKETDPAFLDTYGLEILSVLPESEYCVSCLLSSCICEMEPLPFHLCLYDLLSLCFI